MFASRSSRNCPYYRCSVLHKPGNNYTNLIRAESPCLPATRSASKCVLSLSFILRKRSKGNKKTQPVCLAPAPRMVSPRQMRAASIQFDSDWQRVRTADSRSHVTRLLGCVAFLKGAGPFQPEEGSKGKQASKKAAKERKVKPKFGGR